MKTSETTKMILKETCTDLQLYLKEGYRMLSPDDNIGFSLVEEKLINANFNSKEINSCSSCDETTSSSLEMSSPESDNTFLDFAEPTFDESENFMMQKYPSVEIDWASLYNSM